MADPQTEARRRRLAARPWEAAGPEEIWEITGDYQGHIMFTHCLAITLPEMVTGQYGPDYRPVFTLIGPTSTSTAIPAAYVTHARPLLLVHRDDPHQAYFDTDQDVLDRHYREATP